MPRNLIIFVYFYNWFQSEFFNTIFLVILLLKVSFNFQIFD